MKELMMASDWYVLCDRVAVPCDDLEQWSRKFEDAKKRRVAWDERGDVHVSTVFIGLDHSFGEGPPLLFETMVFGGEHDGDQDRCSTWDEAEVMHRKMCEKVWEGGAR